MVWDGVGIVWGWLGLFEGGRIALARRVGGVLVVQTEAVSFGWSAVHLRPPRRRVGVGRGFIFGCKTAVSLPNGYFHCCLCSLIARAV